jgi:uncharacterized protein
MTIIDVNILLYAYDLDAPQNVAVAAWLERLFGSPDMIGLPWQAVWAFLRISTDRRTPVHQKTPAEVFQIVRSWLAQPGVVLVQPGPRHFEILERLVVEGQAAGLLVSDAVLAALAIENGATLASTDRDFSRFSGLLWVNPLA